jgi:redox-sensitive bicupin YhaK (pirin superfamily)
MTPPVDVRRSGERFLTRTPGVETRHSFSFGRHYDPANTSYGPLLLHDEHRLEPCAGFDPHPHRDLDIVTWVLDGTLLHEHDDVTTTVPAGGWQRLVTGPGAVTHAERAGPGGARFVQLWLAPLPAEPAYRHGVAPDGRLVARADGTAVHVLRLQQGQQQVLPRAPRLHVFVGRGVVDVGATRLQAGDCARLDAEATGTVRVRGAGELLVVEMHGATAGGMTPGRAG